MPTTVFYAWQSDRPEDACRYFIRDALKNAIKKLAADVNVEDAPVLDHDTKDLPGTPHIAESILKKIHQCGAFVADLTFVAECTTADHRTKRLPNSNVLIELGVAMEAVGWEHILLIQNDSFGPPDDLPFDLKHHSFPIRYTLAADSDPEAKIKRKALADHIADKLRIILKNVLTQQDTERKAVEVANASAAQARASELREKFESRVVEGGFRNFRADHGILALSIFPTIPPSQPLDLKAYKEVIVQSMKPIGATSWGPETHGKSICTVNTEKDQLGMEIRSAVTEIDTEGNIFAVARLDFEGDIKDLTKPVRVRFHGVEGQLFERVRSYCRLLRARLKVAGSLTMNLSLYKVNRFLLLPEYSKHEYSSLRAIAGDSIIVDPVILDGDLMFASTIEAGNAIRDAMDHLWRECGLDDDPYLRA